MWIQAVLVQIVQVLVVHRVYKMTIKIHQISKEDLSQVVSIDLVKAGMANTSGMTISNFASALKSTEATIPFDLVSVEEHVPANIDVDFCITIRKKVNLTATGATGKTRTGIGEDIGEYNYTDNVPSRPLDLPPGFQELYRK